MTPSNPAAAADPTDGDVYRGRVVVVTGGAGFIGSHLVEALLRRGAAGVEVLDNLTSGRLDNLPEDRRVHVHALDLRTDDVRPLLEEQAPAAIFHLAGNAYIPDSVRDPAWDFEENILATIRLLEAVRHAAPTARLVFSSSAAVYGEGSPEPFREQDPTDPVSPYGVSKLAAERYVAVYARLWQIRAGIARIFPVYGPRLRKQVLYDLMCRIRADPHELFLHGDGTQVRDCNHVTNVVDALLLIGDRGELRGEAYNVASGELVTIAELARETCTRMGVTPRLVFSGHVRPGDALKWSADISRIASLGYSPRRRLAEGLSETIAWFRQDAEAPR
ncbi:MAG: NAD-dependent epimerase/dehydratase family protein [Acidobacteriota bacterium]